MKTIRAIAAAVLVMASAVAHADVGAPQPKSHLPGLEALEKNPKALNLTVQSFGKTTHVTLALNANPTHFESKEVFGYMGLSKSGQVEPMQESVGLRVVAVPVAIMPNGALVVRLALDNSRLDALKTVNLGDRAFQLADISRDVSEATLVVKDGEEVPVMVAQDAGKRAFQVSARLAGSGDALPAAEATN